MKRSSVRFQSVFFPTIALVLIVALGIIALIFEIVPNGLTFTTIVCVLISFFPYILMCITFYKIVMISPGETPQLYIPNVPEKELEYAKQRYDISVMKDQKLIDMLYPARYCGICKQFRPPRSYHCKKCGVCILKRDHHCPWIGQCVGYFNHKYFIQFLFYATISLFVGVIWHAFGLGFSLLYGEEKPTDAFRIFGFIIDISLGFAVGLLLMTHVHSICINTTGQESIELSHLRKKGVTKLRHSNYHMGVFHNLQSVLGERLIDWIYPTPVKGDGVNFRKRLEVED
ncbi:Palmitoyltransferase [Entamoeba marina]